MQKSIFAIEKCHDYHVENTSNELSNPGPEGHDQVESVLLPPLLDNFRPQNSTHSCLVCVALDVRKCQGIHDHFRQAIHYDPEAVSCQEATEPQDYFE